MTTFRTNHSSRPIHRIAAIAMLASLLPATVRAQSSPPIVDPSPPSLASGPDQRGRAEEVPVDPLFPGPGGVTLALATGVPFAGIGELAVGTSEAFTLGVIGGITDLADEYGLGGRARVRVLGAGPMSVVLSIPVLYYPPVTKRQDEPWILANPSILVRGRLGADAGMYGGVGLLAASCTHSLAQHFGGEHPMPTGAMPQHRMVNGAWNTAHAGGWMAVGRRTSLFLDGALMLEGLELSASYADRVGVPALAEVGVSRSF